jgi:hypothetical protein
MVLFSLLVAEEECELFLLLEEVERVMLFLLEEEERVSLFLLKWLFLLEEERESLSSLRSFSESEAGEGISFCSLLFRSFAGDFASAGDFVAEVDSVRFCSV